MKIVSQLDTEGYFLSATTADESPLEPGIFLLPANSFDIEPPIIKTGYRAKYNGITFIEEEIPPVITDSVPLEVTSLPEIVASISMGDLRIGLLRMKLLSQVDTLIVDPELRIKWEYDTVIKRDSVLVQNFGLTETELDSLFLTNTNP